MGFLDTIDSVKISAPRSPYLALGQYLVEIEEYVIANSENPDTPGDSYNKIGVKVLESVGAEANTPGSQATIFFGMSPLKKFASKHAARDAKLLFAAAMNEPATQVTAAEMDKASKDGSLKGLRFKVTGYQKEPGSKYVNYVFAPAEADYPTAPAPKTKTN